MDFVRVGLPPALEIRGFEPFQLCLSWTCLLLGLWCLLSTSEWISRRDLFDDRGLLSGRVLSLRSQRFHRSRLLEPIYHRPGVVGLLGLRIACAFSVMWPIGGWFRVGALVAMVVTGWLFKLRKWLSEDGSDQMGELVAIGATLTALGLQWEDLLLCLAGVLLIAGQLIISYFVAGLSKLTSFEWRSGRALVGIMGTQSFGHRGAARIASSSASSSIALCWLVILSESTFPAFMLAPGSVLVGVLALFAMVHVATALLMGLNTYVWAFFATYPAVLTLNALLAEAMNRA